MNNLSSLAEPGGSCSTLVSRCTTFSYDANNQRTQITYPSGETIKIGYDTSQREISVKAYRPAGGLFAARSYSYATPATVAARARRGQPATPSPRLARAQPGHKSRADDIDIALMVPDGAGRR